MSNFKSYEVTVDMDTNLINALVEKLVEYKKPSLNIQQGYYDTYANGLQAHNSYFSVMVPCSGGEKYRCTAKVSGGPAVRLVIFYKEDGTRLSSLESTTGTYTDYEFMIPDDAASFSVTSYLGTPTVDKLMPITSQAITSQIDISIPYNMFVRWNGTTVEVLSKYNNTTDLMITIEKTAVNKLPQISHTYTLPNKCPHVKNDFNREKTILNSVTTDYVGPYKNAKAKQNIDGDGGTKLEWTGGWHNYGGSAGNSGGITARNSVYELYVDNVLVSQDDKARGANEVKILVVNLIQGANTAKADGSGRAIIEERVIYKIVGGRLDVDVEIKCLEELTIDYYCGLQAELKAKYGSGIHFVGDSEQVVPIIGHNWQRQLSSGNKGVSDCYTVQAWNGTDLFEVYLDSTFGLGCLRYNPNTKIVHVAEKNSKVYFNLIVKEKLFKSGQVLNWRGGYRFYSASRK